MPGGSFLGLNWPFLPISGKNLSKIMRVFFTKTIVMGQDLNWPKLADFWPNLWPSGKLKKVS